ncbi:MAG TPA: aa3-type cytochrome c oxidase subunit IV [Devosiaceae bacterium]
MAQNQQTADLQEHVKTYDTFMRLTKWGIFAAVMVVVALYCFVIAGQPFLGVVLLLAVPVVAVVRLVTSYSS